MSILGRIAQRLQNFYVDLAAHSVYNPDLEENPARTRWRVLARKVKDGSFHPCPARVHGDCLSTFSELWAQG